jgi:hypothetical protein
MLPYLCYQTHHHQYSHNRKHCIKYKYTPFINRQHINLENVNSYVSQKMNSHITLPSSNSHNTNHYDASHCSLSTWVYLNGSSSSLFPKIDSSVALLDATRDSKKADDLSLDADDGLTYTGIVLPVGGKPIPRRPAKRVFVDIGVNLLVRADFRTCKQT